MSDTCEIEFTPAERSVLCLLLDWSINLTNFIPMKRHVTALRTAVARLLADSTILKAGTYAFSLPCFIGVLHL